MAVWNPLDIAVVASLNPVAIAPPTEVATVLSVL